MSDKRKQELHCHECGRYVQFELDLELNGRHVLKCPNCNHEHCRVVKDGEITDARWDQRNGPIAYGNTQPIYYVATTHATTASVYDNRSAGGGQRSAFIVGAWANTSSATTGNSRYYGSVVVK